MALKQKTKTQTKIKPKTKIIRSHKKAALFGGLALCLALIVAVQVAFIHDLYARTDRLGVERIQYMIVDSARDQGHKPAVDPRESKAYIPEARLVLPLQNPQEHQDGILDLRYFGDQQSVTFTTAGGLYEAAAPVWSGRTLTETLDAVPKFQACARQVIVLFAPGDSGSLVNKQTAKEVFTRKLSDGRTLYAYQDTACTCDATKLIAYLKTIDSY